MAKSQYATAMARKNVVTPQSEAIPGRESEMQRNNAGGMTFTVSKWQMLERFLILGSDAPTYYSSAQKLTKDNAKNVLACLKEDGKKTVDMIVNISVAGRAPKNDPALFALALAATPQYSSLEVAHYATSQLSKVARTGTMLRHFAEYINGMRGWGRNLKNSFGEWFTNRSENSLAYQLAKYQQRDGWTSKDLLNLAHPKTNDPRKSALLAWATAGGLDALKQEAEGWTRTPKAKATYKFSQSDVSLRRGRFQAAYNLLTGTDANKLIAAMERAKKATDVKEVVKCIHEGGLSHEMIPTQFKTNPEVWDALLTNMTASPKTMTAMVRNLGNMSKYGLLTPLSAASKLIVSRLTDEEFVKGSKMHPLQLLLAYGTYGTGHGVRSDGSWKVVQPVMDALQEAFYLAFKNVVPTGKNIMFGVDCSGSMSCSFNGTPLTHCMIAAAMMMAVARSEKNYATYGFHTGIIDVGVKKSDTLEQAVKKFADKNFGGTDCSLPMTHALKTKMDVDAFVVITDCETWAGRIQPVQALQQFRKATGKSTASLTVIGTAATSFTIADPKDPFMLDVVGFDTYVPALVADFIRGGAAGTTEDSAEEEAE